MCAREDTAEQNFENQAAKTSEDRRPDGPRWFFAGLAGLLMPDGLDDEAVG